MKINPSKIKLLALDLDGTLLNRNHEMSERTIKAVRNAHNKGYQIVICTGRRYASSLPHIKTLGCINEIILDNGIIIKNTENDKTIFANYMDGNTYSEVIKIISEIGLIPVVISDDYPSKDIFIRPQNGSNPYHRDFIEYNLKYCKIVETLSKPPSQKIIQIAVFEEYSKLIEIETILKKYIAHLIDFFTIRAIRYAGSSLELVPKGTSKWNALAFLLKLKGINADETIAIGDDVNDIEMIKNAGYGIAMENAFDEVKSVADYITGDRDKDGAAEIIEKLL